MLLFWDTAYGRSQMFNKRSPDPLKSPAPHPASLWRTRSAEESLTRKSRSIFWIKAIAVASVIMLGVFVIIGGNEKRFFQDPSLPKLSEEYIMLTFDPETGNLKIDSEAPVERSGVTRVGFPDWLSDIVNVAQDARSSICLEFSAETMPRDAGDTSGDDYEPPQICDDAGICRVVDESMVSQDILEYSCQMSLELNFFVGAYSLQAEGRQISSFDLELSVLEDDDGELLSIDGVIDGKINRETGCLNLYNNEECEAYVVGTETVQVEALNAGDRYVHPIYVVVDYFWPEQNIRYLGGMLWPLSDERLLTPVRLPSRVILEDRVLIDEPKLTNTMPPLNLQRLEK